jgi:hypothetical protein
LIRTLERLEAVYPHFTDIVLIIGGLAERPLSGILMGQCPEINKYITESGGRLTLVHHLIIGGLAERPLSDLLMRPYPEINKNM